MLVFGGSILGGGAGSGLDGKRGGTVGGTLIGAG